MNCCTPCFIVSLGCVNLLCFPLYGSVVNLNQILYVICSPVSNDSGEFPQCFRSRCNVCIVSVQEAVLDSVNHLLFSNSWVKSGMYSCMSGKWQRQRRETVVIHKYMCPVRWGGWFRHHYPLQAVYTALQCFGFGQSDVDMQSGMEGERETTL